MKKTLIAYMVLSLLASAGCGGQSVEDRARKLNDKYCVNLKKDKDYDRCLAKLAQLQAAHPGEAWAVCPYAVKFSARWLKNDALMIERYTIRFDPPMCELFVWAEQNRAPLLAAINACAELGGAPWMSAAAWREFMLKVTPVKPLSDVRERCQNG